MRDLINKKIAGVCAGLGNELDIDPIIIRMLFVLLFLCFGFGLFIYIILWLVMPSK